MKIAFIISKVTLSSPLGIMCLSSALKKAGHETFLICYQRENLFKELEKIKPDIIAYSVTSGMHKEFLALNRKIKEKFKVFSIFGGPHVTFYPEMVEEEGVDAICRGEGEEAFVDFANKFEKKQDFEKTENFWVKKNKKIIKNPPRKLIENLDILPFPDRAIVYDKEPFFKDLEIKRFMATRGCPFQCTYCFNRHYNTLYAGKGKIIRHRSVDNVIKEIKEVRSNYNLKAVKFIDDTFNIDKEWLKEFSEKYRKEINLPLICNIRADLVTEENVRQLKQANCIVVYIGIETGDEKLRKEVLKRNMSNEKILNACKLLKKAGIKIVSQNIIALPGETLEGAFKTILFNAKCKVDYAGYSIFQPYPNTVLTNYAIEKGFFDGDYDKLNTFFITTPLNYSQKEKRQFENLYKLSTMTSRYPFLFPIVKLLIKLPKNKIHNLLYTAFYGLALWKVYSKVFGSYLEAFKLMKKLSEYTSQK